MWSLWPDSSSLRHQSLQAMLQRSGEVPRFQEILVAVLRMDTLSNALSTILNNEIRHKHDCIIAPASRLIGDVLRILQMNGYIGKFEFIDDGRAGKFDVQLLGRINKCGTIRPRYSSQIDELEEWEERFLPSKDLGVLIVSTPEGVISHREARERRVGGRLLAYVY